MNSPLTKYLKKASQLKHQEAIKSQNWKGKFLSTVWNDENLAEQYLANMGWKNIPDSIETTHIEVMQQLLPTYVYQKEHLNKQDLPVVCRACTLRKKIFTMSCVIAPGLPKIFTNLATTVYLYIFTESF